MNERSSMDKMIDSLRKAPEVALFSHVSPDGDCIGSMLAVGLSLEKLGKKITFYNPDPVPRNLAFLPGASRINSELPDFRGKTLLFIDCSDLQRVNLSKADIPEKSVVLNLDHHISNEYFGHHNLVNPKASASGEIAYMLIKELGVEISVDIAANLYTALVTDTGCFQYGNTTAQTHRLTAELLEKGLDLALIHHHIFDQKPLAQIKLLQYALNGLEIHADGQLAVMSLSIEDFQKSGAGQELSDGLVNHARSIAGVEAAVLLREVGPELIKGGLRSNLWLNVNEIAAKFGGGGHQRAAGCTFKTSMSEAKQKIVAEIEEALKAGRNH